MRRAGAIVALVGALSLLFGSPALAAPVPETFYGGYHTVFWQEEHLTQVASTHPDLATVYRIGQSWLMSRGTGGHYLQAICLTKKNAGDCELIPNSVKPRFVLMAQIHPREISTGELASGWIDYLVNNYSQDPTVKSIMDTTELWVIPVANPDGADAVAAGGDTPVSQRKNLDNSIGSCAVNDEGVDLNRNSTFEWGKGSMEPCSTDYQGPSAGSEPETRALEGFFRAIYPKRTNDPLTQPVPVTTRGTMITLHSYGNDIIVPWGWTDHPAPDDAKLRALARKMAASNGYTVGTDLTTVGYPTPGTTDDFTYGVLGVASFTIEVGGNDNDQCGGFFPRFSCVSATLWPQVLPALLVAARAAAAPYQ